MLCLSWTAHDSLLVKIAKEVAKDTKIIITINNNKKGEVETLLSDYRVNVDNICFLQAKPNSAWIRDFGPHWIYTKNGDREIIDVNYNRKRPRDKKISSIISNHFNVPLHKCKHITLGGNIIFDGHGMAIISDKILENFESHHPEVAKEIIGVYLKFFFGVQKIIFLKSLNSDGTGHLDMFCKLLNDTTCIIGEYENADACAPGNYHILNHNAEKIALEKNGKGEKITVFKVPMPAVRSKKRGGYITYSYTNSLICNKKVLIPHYNLKTDSMVYKLYKELMPVYKGPCHTKIS